MVLSISYNPINIPPWLSLVICRLCVATIVRPSTQSSSPLIMLTIEPSSSSFIVDISKGSYNRPTPLFTRMAGPSSNLLPEQAAPYSRPLFKPLSITPMPSRLLPPLQSLTLFEPSTRNGQASLVTLISIKCYWAVKVEPKSKNHKSCLYCKVKQKKIIFG